MMDLTKQERQVLVFLLAVSLTGMGMQFLAKNVPPLEKRRLLENVGKIDLNTADKEALKGLPGIGEGLARRIIEYREREDGFTDLGDLEKVKGIRRGMLGRIRECVYIR